MKKAATGGQFRELIGKLLTKIGDDKIATIEHQQIQTLIDSPNDMVDGFIAWINTGVTVVTKTITETVHKLAFLCEVIIGTVSEFVVSDKFQHRAKSKFGIPLWMSKNFTNWILNPMKSKKVACTEKTKLKKLRLTENMHDTLIKAEAGNPPAIPVATFLPLLWGMLSLQKNGEAKEDGLLNNRYANIFHVLLEDGRVVAVCVGWDNDRWGLDSFELDYVRPWSADNVFWTLATA